MSKAAYLQVPEMEHVLRLLTPKNRLAIETELATGLRISDVLDIKTATLKNEMYIKEKKTGKIARIWINNELLERLKQNGANSEWAFPSRCNPEKHWTRQAVWNDMKRAGKALRIKENLSTHSARKIFAVEFMERHGNIKRLQKRFNHTSREITMIYAYADILDKRRKKGLDNS